MPANEIWWYPSEPPLEDVAHGDPSKLKVNDQHAFPVNIYFRDDQTQEAESLSNTNPLPVRLVPHQTQSIMLPQVAPSTSVATLIAPGNPLRKSLMITNTTGTQIVWINFNRNVLAGNGQYLAATAGSNLTLYGQQEVWGISVSGAQTLSVLEEIETL